MMAVMVITPMRNRQQHLANLSSAFDHFMRPDDFLQRITFGDVDYRIAGCSPAGDIVDGRALGFVGHAIDQDRVDGQSGC